METFPESESLLSPGSGSWGTQAGSRSSSKSDRAAAQSPAEPSAPSAALLLPSLGSLHTEPFPGTEGSKGQTAEPGELDQRELYYLSS